MTTQAFSDNWKSNLNSRVLEFGRQNWIVIADPAYPKQSAEGIETVYTGEEQLEVLEYVLKQIDKAKHVRPLVMLDKELNYVAEATSPGARDYREGLIQLFEDSSVTMLPHEIIMTKLYTAAESFKVLLLKSDMTIPYISIFIELESGYWSVENEAQMRSAIATSEAPPAAAPEPAPEPAPEKRNSIARGTIINREIFPIKPNLLFVCSRNQWRSPTAAEVYKNDLRINVRSAGLSPKSPHTINAKDILNGRISFS